MLNRIIVFILALLVVIAIIPSNVRVTAASPADAGMANSDGDTLKTLGLLIESNKITNNPLAIKYAKIALAIAINRNSKSDMVDSYKWLGKAFLQNQKDSSYFYYNRALEIADSNRLENQKAPIFFNLAFLYSISSNIDKAMAMLDSSIRLAEMANDPEGMSNAYIMLGTLKYNAHDYENSRRMYELALKTAQGDTLYKQIGVATANLARSQFEKDEKKREMKIKEALFFLSKIKGVEEEMANLFINLGNQKTKKPDSALLYYKTALQLALNANLPKIILGAYNNMVYSYIDKKDVGMAEACLRDNAIPVALELNDKDWLASLYDTYADVCVAKKDYKNAWTFQRKAMKARDAANVQKATEQVRLLAAQLDLNNKELQIQSEKKQLLLQDIRYKKIELWFVIAVLLIVASVFITFILQQRSRARLQKEQIGSAKRIIEMEETEKGRTARELHDLTGQLVLGISGTIENIDFPDQAIKDQINTKIKELGASIRKISHRMNRAMIEHFTFSEMIAGLCEDVQKLSKMKIDLEMADEFPDLPNDLVLHFYRITQELLTNAGKYAKGSQVQLKIFGENERLTLLYADDGPGFIEGEKSKPSMGVLNIYERAKMVGGLANLITAPGMGTKWEIVFPMKQTAK